MNDSIKPLEIIEASLKYGWLLIIVMLLGAGGGYLIQAITPPQYESKAVFSVMIDYTMTGKLTDIEEDQAITTAGDVFQSTQVVEATLDQIKQQQGITLSVADFQKMSYLERTNSEWTLRIRADQPDVSTQIVNIWAEQADRALKEGLRYAHLAHTYHQKLNSLAGCVEQVPSVEPAAPICGYPTFADLQGAMQKFSDDAVKESEQSQGLLAALTITWVNRAMESGSPVNESRNLVMLSGAGLGLLGFIIFISFFLPKHNK